MASVYDILGLTIGIISLLAFAKTIIFLVSSFLPPARVRALEDTIKDMRTLIDRLEGRSPDPTPQAEAAWADHRERLERFAQALSTLWLEVKRWESLGFRRVQEPYGNQEFKQCYRDLKRKIDDFHRHIIQQYLNVPYPLSRRPPSITPETPETTTNVSPQEANPAGGYDCTPETLEPPIEAQPEEPAVASLPDDDPPNVNPETTLHAEKDTSTLNVTLGRTIPANTSEASTPREHTLSVGPEVPSEVLNKDAAGEEGASDTGAFTTCAFERENGLKVSRFKFRGRTPGHADGLRRRRRNGEVTEPIFNLRARLARAIAAETVKWDLDQLRQERVEIGGHSFYLLGQGAVEA